MLFHSAYHNQILLWFGWKSTQYYMLQILFGSKTFPIFILVIFLRSSPSLVSVYVVTPFSRVCNPLHSGVQSKGDLSGAEHYYFQATLADPKDGDTLSQYAKLVWELHRDKDIASDYFERAVHAAPENRL